MRIRALSAVACALWLTHCSHAPTTLEAQAPSASSAPAPAVSSKESTASARPTYPVARKDDVVDDYHGTKVADPYRWLEDPDSPETRQWVEAQNKLTFGYLEKIPARAQIKQRLTELWDYEKYGVPWREGGRYFFSRNDGLQNQSVLYAADSLDAEPRVLLDPNTLSTDGTVALAGMAVSEDGKLLAYGLAAAGSDWKEMARPRRAHRRGPAGRSSSGSSSPAPSWTQGRQGLLLQPLRRAQGRRGAQRRQLLPEALLPPARHAAGRGRRSSTSARTRRSGASAATSPTTARYLVITVAQRHRRARTASSTRT